jgi:hypothetical protein
MRKKTRYNNVRQRLNGAGAHQSCIDDKANRVSQETVKEGKKKVPSFTANNTIKLNTFSNGNN